jgi:hypothetical protein
VVTNLRYAVGTAHVYTLTVATNHDFFVGTAQVLVHNCEVGTSSGRPVQISLFSQEELDRLGAASEGFVEDYLGNNYAFRLCSERLRAILEGRRAACDSMQWLAAPVTDTQGRILPYSILHFTEVPEVIDRTKSLLAGPTIVKPCLNGRLVGSLRVFSLPEDTVTLIISDEVKQAVEDAGCTGMGFSKIPIA